MGFDNSVLIVGCGNIGFRHFQGALSSKTIDTIYLYDTSLEAIEVCLQWASKVSSSIECIIIKSIEEAPSSVFSIIIATGSRPRLAILRELAGKISCHALILEKILFPMVDEYSEAEALLPRIADVSFVNCSRRVMPCYQGLVNQLNSSPIQMTVCGEDWGLGCNGIHYLDLFEFLLPTDIASIKYSSGFLADPIDSKRPGYDEIVGVLGFSAGESSLVLSSFPAGCATLPHIMLVQGNLKLNVFESENSVIIVDGTKVEHRPNIIKFQSELTGELLDNLKQGSCDLPTYESSSKLHKLFLETVNAELMKRGVVTYVMFT